MRREPADHGRAVGFHEQRRGAPGRVRAEMLFRLDQRHARMPGEPRGKAHAGNAAADDEHVHDFRHRQLPAARQRAALHA